VDGQLELRLGNGVLNSHMKWLRYRDERSDRASRQRDVRLA